jgi:D-alanine-D-alanine ligase
MYPKMWDVSGLKYSQLIEKIIELGFERYKTKQSKKVSFDEVGDWFK